MKQNLARYKVPREIVFLDELPRNATGKVLKRELAERRPEEARDPGDRPGGRPDFTLRDQHGQDVSLSSFRGRKAVVVMFYPFAFSRVCTGELCAVRDRLPTFESDDVQVLALSCDPMFALRAFAEQDGLTFPLLSDFWPHGAVARAYGVFNEERGCSDRSTFIVDKDGRAALGGAQRDAGRPRPRRAGPGAHRSDLSRPPGTELSKGFKEIAAKV